MLVDKENTPKRTGPKPIPETDYVEKFYNIHPDILSREMLAKSENHLYAACSRKGVLYTLPSMESLTPQEERGKLGIKYVSRKPRPPRKKRKDGTDYVKEFFGMDGVIAREDLMRRKSSRYNVFINQNVLQILPSYKDFVPEDGRSQKYKLLAWAVKRKAHESGSSEPDFEDYLEVFFRQSGLISLEDLARKPRFKRHLKAFGLLGAIPTLDDFKEYALNTTTSFPEASSNGTRPIGGLSKSHIIRWHGVLYSEILSRYGEEALKKTGYYTLNVRCTHVHKNKYSHMKAIDALIDLLLQQNIKERPPLASFRVRSDKLR